jgi:hypothetical protein
VPRSGFGAWAFRKRHDHGRGPRDALIAALPDRCFLVGWLLVAGAAVRLVVILHRTRFLAVLFGVVGLIVSLAFVFLGARPGADADLGRGGDGRSCCCSR